MSKKRKITIVLDCRNREIGRLWEHETLSEFLDRRERIGVKPFKRPIRTIIREA